MVSSGRAFGNSNLMLVRNESSTDMSIVAVLASCSPIALQVQRGSGSLEDAIANCGQKRSGHYALYEGSGEDPGDEDLGDEYTQQVEKKRRLTFDQVRSLEKNFEIENKLEPERKMQLAKELGLQPRQVAVWFQNRRARWKIKQLERDYEVLSSDFNRLKSDYDAVLQEKEELEGERAYLTEKMQTAAQPEQAADLPEKIPKNPGLSSQLDDPAPQLETCHGEQVAKTDRKCERDGSAGGKWGKETSSGSISSELLNADSPDSGELPPLDNIGDYPQSISPLEMGGESNIIHMNDLLGDQLLSLHGCHRISVKLEDGSFQDESCNYMLPHLDEERGLPWWDWP